MAESQDARRRVQGRSPPFPFIPLGTAIERAEKLDRYSKGHPLRASAAVGAWGFSTASSGGKQTIAALKAFRLLTDSGNNEDRVVQISDLARRLFRNPPPDIRRKLVAEAALSPPLIREFWELWAGDRPADDACRWKLTDERGLTDDAAARFLTVYDATVSYAGLVPAANMSPQDEDLGADLPDELDRPREGTSDPAPEGRPSRVEPDLEVRVMEGERELEKGLLSREASFRLIVKGEVGPAEIDRLIKRLLLTKEILADQAKAPAQLDMLKDEPGGRSVLSVAA